MNIRNQFWRKKSKDTSFINDIKKYPELKNLIRYDKNFNNKHKVAFESALAGNYSRKATVSLFNDKKSCRQYFSRFY